VSPLLKTGQALTLEIRHLAAPLAIHATVSAEGVEDDSTGATQAALRLREQVSKLRLLIAVELLVAAQAVELAAPARLGRGTGAAQRCVRELVSGLGDDRPLGPEVEVLAREALASGLLLHRTRGALA
jgi:histidine ammonia-lyase